MFDVKGRNIMRPVILIFCALVVSLTGCKTAGLFRVKQSLSDTAWGSQRVSATHPVFLGKMSQRFEVRHGDCFSDRGWSDCKADRKRSEVIADSAKFYPGSDIWISFMIYLPKDFETSYFVNANLGQIHMKGGFNGTAGGLKSFPPLLQMNAKGNTYNACYHVLTGNDGKISDRCNNKVITSIESMKGRWNRVTLHLLAQSKKPIVDIFFNSVHVAHFEQSLSKDPEYYFLKYGIYRSFVSRHRGPMPTQVAYYDEVKVGTSKEEVENEQQVLD